MSSSTKERDALLKFLERLRDVTIPEEIRREVFLLKFLKARDFDLDKAEKMFRAHLGWREKWRPEYLRDVWKPPPALEKYGAFGFIGYDREGSPVMLADQGVIDVKGIFSSVTKDDYIRWFIQKLEQCRQKMRLGQGYGEGSGAASQFVIVVELQGWSFTSVFSKPVVEVAVSLAQMQEANYPEHLKRLYLLNMPRFFTMALAVVRPFLNQTTQEKIVCLGSKDQFEPVLTKAISKDVLPKFWGGNRVDEDGDPKCSSLTGKGGKVPKSLYRTSKGAKEAQEEEKNEEKLGGVERRAVSLRGGEALNLECRAPHPGSLLSWEFSTEKEGVEYLVLRVDGEQVDIHQEDVSGRRVREKERANSHQETVSGEILLQEPGLYCLRFHSKATSDRLSYAILVTPPPDRL